MLYYERKFRKQGYDFIIGVDEAGRGSLAGPVVAAAVSLDAGIRFKSRIDDSKKLTPRQRDKAYIEIAGNSLYGVGVVSEEVIDRLNILVATRIAMEKAVRGLLRKIAGCPRFRILVDGDIKLSLEGDITSLIRGDLRSQSIACASIIAKVSRDRMMVLYHRAFPQYGFFQHKGYGTKMHFSRLRQYGLSAIHRKSFCSGMMDPGGGAERIKVTGGVF